MKDYWIIILAVTFILGAFLTSVSIPKVLAICHKKKLYDLPDDRKIHTSAIPRLGGMVFVPSALIAVVIVAIIDAYTEQGLIFNELCKGRCTLAFSFCSILAIYIVGATDDLIGCRYRTKFLIQAVCACLFLAGGVWLGNLHGIFWTHALVPAIGMPLTILAVVFVVNAVNMIDGIDGLAAGLGIIAFVCYGITFYILRQYALAAISFAMLGILAVFFVYNVIAQEKHKTFMGDTGSLTMGMVICFLSLELCNTPADEFALNSPNPFALAFAPLLVPCLDVMRVFIIRIHKGRNPFKPDKTHIHHLLMDCGLGQHSAMASIVALSLAYAVCNIALSQHMDLTLLLIADIALYAGIYLCLSSLAFRRCKNA